MKNSFYLFLLFLGFTDPLSSQSINESLVKKHIYTLANDSMQGRKAGTEGIEKAAKYIEGQFQKIGLKYFNNNSFRQTFKYKNKRSRNQEELKLFNIIGFLEGNEKKDEIVVVSAHYDHLGMKSTGSGDLIFNGANDNATGVAAVLALAEYFKSKNNNSRSILFIAFTACLLYTSPSPRDATLSRMPSSA